MSWVEKYKPRTLNEIKIDNDKLFLLKKLVLDKKPIIIYGKSGVGKTCSIYALAKELNYEVIEVNATDLRNKANVNLILGQASAQRSLFKEGKILLIDEVDALTGIDRGGATTIATILKESKSSVVLTANDPYGSKLSPIRKKCKLIEFEKVKNHDALSVLKNILEKEGIKCSRELLLQIIKQSNGDLRAAINDLQVSACGTEEIKKLHLSERENKENIFRILNTIFKKRNVKGVSDKLEVDYNELILWLEENLPREYSGRALANGFDALSKADIFRKRIRRQNYWRFLVYIRDLITHGVALSKDRDGEGFVGYKRGSRILKYWLAKQRTIEKRAAADEIAGKTHSCYKKIMKDFYFYEIINKKFKIY